MTNIRKIVARVFEEVAAEQGSANDNGRAASLASFQGRALNDYERRSILALITYSACALEVTTDEVRNAVQAFLAINDISDMDAEDYEPAIRFLVDLKSVH